MQYMYTLYIQFFFLKCALSHSLRMCQNEIYNLHGIGSVLVQRTLAFPVHQNGVSLCEIDPGPRIIRIQRRTVVFLFAEESSVKLSTPSQKTKRT